MHCQIHSSDRTLFDGETVMVVARSALGDFAVMARHAPLVAVLAPGPVRVKTSQGETAFAVRGGLLRVLENRVTVLAEAAIPAAEIDIAALASRMEEVENALMQADEKEELLRELAYLRAQRRVTEHHA
jgi:F-type H+-transporting ATPase subunit epsilon